MAKLVFNPFTGTFDFVGTTGGSLPVAAAVGDQLVSLDGSSFSSVQPVVSPTDGWLANLDGELLVEGILP